AEFVVLPSTDDWSSFPFSTGGSSTVINGVLIVDGARFNTEPSSKTFSRNSTIEFVATFNAATFQHIGYGAGTDSTGTNGIYVNLDNPWAIFSTGTSHLYRIEWIFDGSFKYYIDNTLVYTETTAKITSSMRVAISDFTKDGIKLKVEWIHVTPYAFSGVFESRIYDAGSLVKWGRATWATELPSGTSLQVKQRTGNTAIPDGTWTAYANIVSNGTIVGSSSRYIQYQAVLATADGAKTSLLKDIHFNCAVSK
ncbi:unnamed protein product, partial [Didymodactylos carnosus]